ncbi:MAG: thioesterase family protein [Planctomycetota bacterium]|nr:thioesterase family protein [Planctomycetota bacterium]
MTEPTGNANLRPRAGRFDLSRYDVPHPRPFLLDLTVAGDELSNVIDHVSNVEYVRWLDRAAELHADSVGDTRQRLLERDLMWFVARHEIDYLAEAHLGDELLIATWVRDMKRIRSWRETIIIRPADETTVCRASTLWVLVRLSTRRPARIAAEMARRFEPWQDLAEGVPTVPGERGDAPCTSR